MFTKLFKGFIISLVLSILAVSNVLAYDTTPGVFVGSGRSKQYYTRRYEDTTKPLLAENGNVYWVNENGTIIVEDWIEGMSMEDPSVMKWYYADGTGACVENGLKMDRYRTWYYFNNHYMVSDGGLRALPEHDNRLVYISEGEGSCYQGFHVIDGYTYYFGAFAVDNGRFYMPVAARGEILKCIDDGEWHVFDDNSHMIDTSNITEPTIVDVGGRKCVVTGPNTFLFNNNITIDGITYTVNSYGFVSKETVDGV